MTDWNDILNYLSEDKSAVNSVHYFLVEKDGVFYLVDEEGNGYEIDIDLSKITVEI